MSSVTTVCVVRHAPSLDDRGRGAVNAWDNAACRRDRRPRRSSTSSTTGYVRSSIRARWSAISPTVAPGPRGRCTCPTSDAVLWSDVRKQPSDATRRSRPVAVTVADQPANFCNGHTLDRQGSVVVCEHGTRSVVRLTVDGSRKVVADRFDGKRFNSPNDVVVASDESVWFTDPTYGIDSDAEGHRADSEIGSSNVYRVDGGTAAVTRRDHRHGAAERAGVLARRERRCTCRTPASATSTSGPRHIRRYDVVGGSCPRGRRGLRDLPRGGVRRVPPRRRRSDLDERPAGRALLSPRRHAARHDPPARGVRQRRLRRRRPAHAVHGREHIAVLARASACAACRRSDPHESVRVAVPIGSDDRT